MEDEILVTFVFDVELLLKKKLNLYYGISKTIRKKLKYKDHRAKYIFFKYNFANPSNSEKVRISITYEIKKEDSNLFIFKVKENVSMIFKSKENSYVKLNEIKLMNEDLDISYHAGYWNHFLHISDSPRTDSSTHSPIIPRK